MSDQVQENAVEEEILEDVVDSADQEVEAVESDDNLDEAKKASMGDPSEIPDPEPKKAPEPKAKMPTTKVAMIQAMVDYAKGKKKDEVKQMVKSMYSGSMNSKYHPTEEVEATGPTLKEIINRINYEYEDIDYLKKYIGNKFEEIIDLLDLLQDD